MDNGTLIYLASPYSHADPKVREIRFKEVCKEAARLMQEGWIVFCPIAHSHPIAEYGNCDATSHDFWLVQDFGILKHCKMLFVYMMPGWKKSFGVNAEIDFAIANEIPVCYLEYTGELKEAA